MMKNKKAGMKASVRVEKKTKQPSHESIDREAIAMIEEISESLNKLKKIIGNKEETASQGYNANTIFKKIKKLFPYGSDTSFVVKKGNAIVINTMHQNGILKISKKKK